MSEAPPPIVAKEKPPVVWVVCGILFIIVWIIAHLAWAGLAFMANAMANDSGRIAEAKHLTLIFGMMVGQVICGAAGIPAGLAFFWRRRRKLLLWLFALLFVGGALIQGGVFYSFFASLP